MIRDCRRRSGSSESAGAPIRRRRSSTPRLCRYCRPRQVCDRSHSSRNCCAGIPSSAPGVEGGARRTLERRVRQRRALHGADQEVIFRLVREPGRVGLSDFTDMADHGVTIAGAPLAHRLYHFRLAYSGFEHAHIVPLSSAGWAARASWPWPRACRTRSGPWVAHRRSIAAGCGVPAAPQQCRHYGMVATRHNRGPLRRAGPTRTVRSKGRTVISSGRSRMRCRSARAREFDDLDAYRRFLDELVGRRNARNPPGPP